MTIPEAARLVLQAAAIGDRPGARARHGRGGAHRRPGPAADPPVGHAPEDIRSSSACARARSSTRTARRRRCRCRRRCRASTSARIANHAERVPGLIGGSPRAESPAMRKCRRCCGSGGGVRAGAGRRAGRGPRRLSGRGADQRARAQPLAGLLEQAQCAHHRGVVLRRGLVPVGELVQCARSGVVNAPVVWLT